VFNYLIQKYGKFFGRLVDNVYDRASIIYRLSKLKFDDGTQVCDELPLFLSKY